MIPVKVSFAGLGRMGAPMAARIAEHGFPLTVWNRTAGRAEPLAGQGARVAATLRELAARRRSHSTRPARPASATLTSRASPGCCGRAGLLASRARPAPLPAWVVVAASRSEAARCHNHPQPQRVR